jgi:hypothetical protein
MPSRGKIRALGVAVIAEIVKDAVLHVAGELPKQARLAPRVFSAIATDVIAAVILLDLVASATTSAARRQARATGVSPRQLTVGVVLPVRLGIQLRPAGSTALLPRPVW